MTNRLPTHIRVQARFLVLSAEELRGRAFLNVHDTWADQMDRAAETIKTQASRIAELEKEGLKRCSPQPT